MIYRVEFRKDGSVASCVEVESQHKDGGLVCYIDAADRADAIGKAKSSYWKLVAAAKKKLSANPELCVTCFKKRSTPGMARCRECQTRNNRFQREKRAIRHLPPEQQAAALAERRALFSAERRQKMRAIGDLGRARATALANERWDADAHTTTKQEKVVLRQVLRAYDRDPANFRSWLLKMLGQEAQAAE